MEHHCGTSAPLMTFYALFWQIKLLSLDKYLYSAYRETDVRFPVYLIFLSHTISYMEDIMFSFYTKM